MATSDQGFASMDDQKQRDIASQVGQVQSAKTDLGNFAQDKHKTTQVGRSRDRTSIQAGAT